MRKIFEELKEGDFAKLNFESFGLAKYGIVKEGEVYEITLDDSRKIEFHPSMLSKTNKIKISQPRFVHNFKSKYSSLIKNNLSLTSLENLFSLRDSYKFDKKLELLMTEDYLQNIPKIHGEIKLPPSKYFVAKKNSYLYDIDYLGIIASTPCFSESIVENILKDNRIIDADYGQVRKIPLIGDSQAIIRLIEKNNPFYLNLELKR